MSKLLDFVTKNKQRFDDLLIDFLRIPSISAQPDRADDVRKCCMFLKSYLEKIGLKPEIHETSGHPIIYAEKIVDPSLPTALIYGHYDVQPVDPLDLWDSPPFEPVIKNGIIYARGSADDKGQLMVHVLALEAYLAETGKLPVNVKIVFEGEEEIASENLDGFLEENREKLSCDLAIISDSSMFGPGMPALTYGLRGITPVEVKVIGPNRDLHSGSYGGAVANPVNILCNMVAALHDENRHITVDGFYDDVADIESWEKEEFARLPFDEADYAKKLGVGALLGEKGFSTLERTWTRPTLDVNGIFGGYMGAGQKTIIPSWAGCKITMRLVPNMDPIKVASQLESYLRKIAPRSVKLEIESFGGAKAAIVSKKNPIMKAAENALEFGFGKKPFYIREGGSIPIVNTFKELLGVDTILFGLCQPDCNAHSPNEWFGIEDYHKGIKSAIVLYEELSKVKV